MVEQENSQASDVFFSSSSNHDMNFLSTETVTDEILNVLKDKSLSTHPFFSDFASVINSESSCNPSFEAELCPVSGDQLAQCAVYGSSTDESKNGSLSDVLTKEMLHECTFDSYNDMTVPKYLNIPRPVSETIASFSEPYAEVNSPISFWGNCPLDLETLKMDDVFQVDKDDLVQSPTLAELNANDESLFDSFDNFNGFLPSEPKIQKVLPTSDAFCNNSVLKISSLCSSNSLKVSSNASVLQKAQNSSQNKYCELGTKLESNLDDMKLQTVPTTICVKQHAKVFTSPNKIQMPLSDSPNMEHCKGDQNEKCKDTKLLTQKKKDHPIPLFLNQNELNSDEESEMDCDYSTEAESDDEKKAMLPRDKIPNSVLLEKKKQRYFWQYNVQSKGPKAMKLKLSTKWDPILSSDSPIQSGKHSGKARRGDGNDLTPNPKKLYHIGLELNKLSSVIDELVPVNELPFNARTRSRKEKNKLASRACRLKKKAQHEANKLKLFGLQQEQKYLTRLITEVKRMIKTRIENGFQAGSSSLRSSIESLDTPVPPVAGCSADFVNKALEQVGSGNDSGGLNIPVVDEN